MMRLKYRIVCNELEENSSVVAHVFNDMVFPYDFAYYAKKTNLAHYVFFNSKLPFCWKKHILFAMDFFKINGIFYALSNNPSGIRITKKDFDQGL